MHVPCGLGMTWRGVADHLRSGLAWVGATASSAAVQEGGRERKVGGGGTVEGLTLGLPTPPVG